MPKVTRSYKLKLHEGYRGRSLCQQLVQVSLAFELSGSLLHNHLVHHFRLELSIRMRLNRFDFHDESIIHVLDSMVVVRRDTLLFDQLPSSGPWMKAAAGMVFFFFFFFLFFFWGLVGFPLKPLTSRFRFLCANPRYHRQAGHTESEVLFRFALRSLPPSLRDGRRLNVKERSCVSLELLLLISRILTARCCFFYYLRSIVARKFVVPSFTTSWTKSSEINGPSSLLKSRSSVLGALQCPPRYPQGKGHFAIRCIPCKNLSYSMK